MEGFWNWTVTTGNQIQLGSPKGGKQGAACTNKNVF